MKIIIRKQITTDVECISKIKCDWCGKESKLEDTITEFKIQFGVGSKYDDDMYVADICDDCFDKHLKNKMKRV